jgi:hypothetical protein
LARGQRNLDLLDEIVELRHGKSRAKRRSSYWDAPNLDLDVSVSEQEVEEAIQEEKDGWDYPNSPEYEETEDFCDCPACRRRRGEDLLDDEPIGEMDLDAETGSAFELPPALAQALIGLAARGVLPDGSLPVVAELLRGDLELRQQFDEILEFCLDEGLPLEEVWDMFGSQKNRGRKRSKRA